MDDETGSEDQALTGGNGRDHLGQFAVGNTMRLGHHVRSPVLDFKSTVIVRAHEDGIDLPEAMWRVVKSLMETATGNDAAAVAAGKLLLDRFHGVLPKELSIDTNPIRTVHVSDHARRELTKLLAEPETQAAVRVELVRMTTGEEAKDDDVLSE